MRLYQDTLTGCVLSVWIITTLSHSQALSHRAKRQTNVYFRESSGGVRFQGQEEPRWSSPSDRLHSRSSVIHDPGPSWSSPARSLTWTTPSLRFNQDVSRSTFKFDSEDASPQSLSSRESSKSSFRFESDERRPSGFNVEGRSNPKLDSEEFSFGFKGDESNEGLFGKSESDKSVFPDSSAMKVDSDEVSLWRSSDESTGFSDVSSKPKNSGRQSKVSPIFDVGGPLSDSVEFPSEEDSVESGRHLSQDTIATISETLGAINTVGRYLVNYTRGGHSRPTPGDRFDPPPLTPSREDLPGAILTISKNVLGRNVTESIAPLVRVLPIGTENAASGVRSCTTPSGRTGYCEDLSNCPQLLLDLGNLRQSICFKSLFVPGVCCPKKADDNTFLQGLTTTARPIVIQTTKPTLVAAPSQPLYTTTAAPNSIEYDSGLGDCGQQEVPKFRVVGGEEALPGRWPWMAAIFLHGPRRSEFWCGGSLIGSKYILTAAHCTKDTRQRPFQARQFTVRLGDIDLRREDEPSSPQTYRVVEVRAHPRFSRVGFYNDIAVLVLERPVRRSRYVIPVCLPPPSYRNSRFIGEQPTVIGWGTTYYGGKESTVQRQVALPVWKNEDCDRTYFQPINENFICAGLKEGGKDACQGDSGGPLILKKNGRWMQIGIVSFGNKCGEPGYPGVYTRITQYLDWINSNT